MKLHPIATNHPQYKTAIKKQKRCRDCVAGSDAIKAEDQLYLPRLSSHTNVEGEAEYQAYKFRALFFNAARRTKAGLVGAATRKDPDIVASNDVVKYLADEVVELRQKIIEEQIEVARLAIVVNVTKDGDIVPQVWFTESVVNWRFKSVGEDRKLTMLVLEDEEEEEKDNPFEMDMVTVRHAFVLEPEGCTYQKFKKVKGDWVEIEVPILLLARGGVPLDHVPAIIVGATGINDVMTEDPMMLDLVDVNISHYHNSADLEHGRHWTALPTAWASGFPTVDREGNDINLTVGGNSAWLSDQPGAQCGYLEFSGSGLGHLAEGMTEKRAMMAVLGARLLEEAKASVEAADTLRVRMVGEQSALSWVAQTCSKALTWTLRELLWWNNPTYVAFSEDTDRIDLDTDFVDSKLTAGDLQALMSALQGEAISYDTFFWCLKRGEIIPAERTLEEEVELIDAGRPGSMGSNPFPPPLPGMPQGFDPMDDSEAIAREERDAEELNATE